MRINKRKKENFLIMLCISILIITVGFNNKNNSKLSNDSFNANTTSSNNLNAINANIDKELVNDDIKYYKIISLYGTDGNISFHDLFESKNVLSRLKNLNKDFKDNFDYLEMGFQPLFYVGHYDKDENFIYSSGSKNNIVKNDEGKEIYVTGIKTLQIGEQALSEFDNLIDVGNNFTAEVFGINSDDETVSCILGSNYKEYHSIGDEIPLVLHQKIINFKVIGFCKQGVSISQYKGSEVNLDNFVIMPFYDINYNPNDAIDELYQKIYYSQKNECYIKTGGLDRLGKTNERDDYNKLVQELANKYDLTYSLASSPVFIEFTD